MKKTSTSTARQSRLSKVVGTLLVAALLCSSQAPAAEASWWTKKIRPDWSAVQAVTRGTGTRVLLHEDVAPRDKQKVKGHLLSATAESITLMLESGQPRTVDRKQVRRVRVVRPLADRHEGILGAVGGTVLGLAVGAKAGSLVGFLLLPAAFASAGALMGFLMAPKMIVIYNVPRDHQRGQKGGSQSAPDRKDL